MHVQCGLSSDAVLSYAFSFCISCNQLSDVSIAFLVITNCYVILLCHDFFLCTFISIALFHGALGPGLCFAHTLSKIDPLYRWMETHK